MPTSSIINNIILKNPDLVLISVTYDNNIKEAEKLVTRLSDIYEKPIIIGWQATNKLKIDDNIIIFNNSLKDLVRLIRKLLKA